MLLGLSCSSHSANDSCKLLFAIFQQNTIKEPDEFSVLHVFFFLSRFYFIFLLFFPVCNFSFLIGNLLALVAMVVVVVVVKTKINSIQYRSSGCSPILSGINYQITYSLCPHYLPTTISTIVSHSCRLVGWSLPKRCLETKVEQKKKIYCCFWQVLQNTFSLEFPFKYFCLQHSLL